MKVGIVGLGLIGSSFARALKAYTNHTVAGLDRDSEVMELAKQEGVINEELRDFSTVDYFLLCLYPQATIDFMTEHKDLFPAGSIIIDCCGVKAAVCTAGEALFKGSPVTFIGGHPMAGRERSGYRHGLADLFKGASMILTPSDDTSEESVKEVTEFFRVLGFSKTPITTPKHHDQVIAYTSQLAHVVSSAYMQSPQASEFMGFSAGSFADLTRVAKLEPNMWTELFIMNSEALVIEVDTLIENLAIYRNLIDSHDHETLKATLAKGSAIKEQALKKI